MTQSIARIHGLAKTFGEGDLTVEAVRGLDLELAPGEIVLVMGPSGSGKTTLLSMLGGLLRPSRGEIWIDGTDIAALSERELPPFRARTFGFIFQDFNLVAALSARENVEVALNIAGRTGAGARERAEGLLTGLGLADRLDFPVEKLSGGEKQRVAIGRALLSSPRLLLLDEPLSSLDEKRKQEVMPFLERLRDHARMPIVYVSHSVAEVERLANSVVFMDAGRVTDIRQ